MAQTKTINFGLAYKRVGEIAASVNKDYYTVRVAKCSKSGIELGAYIAGYSWVSASSVRDLINVVKQMVKPYVKDVCVDKNIGNIKAY